MLSSRVAISRRPIDAAGRDSLLNDPGAEAPGRGGGYALFEDQLHAVRSAEVEIVADHLLEELPTPDRTGKDLGQADLHLPDGELPIVARLAILGSERHRQALQPTGEKRRDLLLPQGIAKLLEGRAIRAGEKPVVESLVDDGALDR